MAQSSIVTLAPSDVQIWSLFQEVQKEFDGKAKYSLPNLEKPLVDEDEFLSKAIKSGSSNFSSASVSFGGVTVSYIPRAIPNGQGYHSPHPYYCIIQTSFQDQQRPPDDILARLQLLLGDFLTREKLTPSQVISDEQNEIGPSAALLSAIQRSASDQIVRTNNFFSKLVEDFDERRRKLTEELDERRLSLEKDYNTKVEEYQQKIIEQNSLIEQDRLNLNNERKTLDDRNNTHARRAIRGELINTIQNRQHSFSISKDTLGLRKPIHCVFVLLLLASFLGSVWSLYVWGTNPTDSWGAVTITSALKTAVFSFSFLTTAGLYVSWMNRWFDKHADVQFQTKQFEIDFNRATWAVEAALEWKALQSEQMPDVLLSGITKHLFEISSAESAEYSPLEALASSILGSAANLKMNMGGTEVDLDRKSIKAIK